MQIGRKPTTETTTGILSPTAFSPAIFYARTAERLLNSGKGTIIEDADLRRFFGASRRVFTAAELEHSKKATLNDGSDVYVLERGQIHLSYFDLTKSGPQQMVVHTASDQWIHLGAVKSLPKAPVA